MNKTAIVVGGTGLYFKTLTEGLSEIPKVPKKDYSKAKKLFSREVLWYGRKGGKFFHSVSNLGD